MLFFAKRQFIQSTSWKQKGKIENAYIYLCFFLCNSVTLGIWKVLIFSKYPALYNVSVIVTLVLTFKWAKPKAMCLTCNMYLNHQINVFKSPNKYMNHSSQSHLMFLVLFKFSLKVRLQYIFLEANLLTELH